MLTLFHRENWTVSCLLDWDLTAHEAMRKHLMQRNRTEPERTLNIYWTLRLKSNLQELGAHGCVSSSPSPDSWHRRHLPSPWDSCYKICISIFCFQIAFSILSVCQAYLVHLSFQNAFLSKPSKITSYCNWSLLCWCISYFLGWCDFFFLAALHCTIFFCH